MPPAPPRLRILSVGGNAVSAYLSWRLQATNACDVTLVWKSGFEKVAQYGISFRSQHFGNERFRPHSVVRSAEEAANPRAPFDYILLCLKALPDVYDIGSIIDSVVTPQHTCILVNTTSALGVEHYIEQRFPSNVVLSLVSDSDIVQLGMDEFEHKGNDTQVWVGPSSKNSNIPAAIQSDMADALKMTLLQGQVDCQVSPNIRQQQYEKMIGNIAFHPTSVLFETPNHAELLEKTGVRPMITGVIDELILLAEAQGCEFPSNFKQQTLERMSPESTSIMYKDFSFRRPMEVETCLGTPMRLAQEFNVSVPRIETMYAFLHHINIVNQSRPPPGQEVQAPISPATQAQPRMSGAPRPPMSAPAGGNGGPMRGMAPRGSRAPSVNGPGPGMRRGPPPNGYPPRPMNGNGYPPGPPGQRRGSFDGNDLEEFSHLMLYDNMPDGGGGGDFDHSNGHGTYTTHQHNMGASTTELALRERELALREREMQLREQEVNMRRGRPPMRPPQSAAPPGPPGFEDDEDDGEDYFDPMAMRTPMSSDPNADIDMMSVTSRRTRKAPSASQLRKQPDMPPPARGGRGGFMRPGLNKNRTSTRLMQDIPGLHDSLMNNSLMGYSSDRYGSVDRKNLGDTSRTNSMTTARLDEVGGPGPYGGAPSMTRRTSHSPGNPLSPNARMGGRPSPPNGYPGPGHMNGGRPSPPGMRAPMPRHPPGQGNMVAPHAVEQHVGVSHLYPPKSGPQVRSLTGSASASAGSGDSANTHLDSENSAHSSQSSLGPRPPLGVR